MLFAGCHVLHRLLVPRHPPDALLILENPCTGVNRVHKVGIFSKKVVDYQRIYSGLSNGAFRRIFARSFNFQRVTYN